MRLTLDLDDRIVSALLARYPYLTVADAIERALTASLHSDSAAGLIALAGSFEVEDVSAELRLP